VLEHFLYVSVNLQQLSGRMVTQALIMRRVVTRVNPVLEDVRPADIELGPRENVSP